MDRSDPKAASAWTPANIVTLARICLVPVFVVAFLSPWPEWFGFENAVTYEVKTLIAAGLFIFISCTDWLDGYLARSRGEVTDFGKFMDPLADKILVAAALLALVELAVLPSWPVLVILAREFIVSGVRMVAASKGEVIAASMWGKAKTVSQIVAIVLFIIKDLYWPSSVTAPGHELNPLYLLSWLVMLVALVLTVVSMVDYLRKARGMLGFGPKGGPAAAVDTATDMGLDARAARIMALAAEAGASIGCAESLTGGLVCATLTDVPGASAVVRGAVVSYALEVKEGLLGVDRALLQAQGAVDGDVARQMAEGARRALGVDVAVATTGIAGPGGAEPGKPVGTVWLAVAGPQGARAELRTFEGSREEVRAASVAGALELLEAALDGAGKADDRPAPGAALA